ncbi:terminase large subunit [Pseudomonas phage LSL4]|nr:terminase large subunit [Pseudomonas phage LSL4]
MTFQPTHAQASVMSDDKHMIILYASHAGGGKSHLVAKWLTEPMHLEGYRGLAARKTIPFLLGPGGLSQKIVDVDPSLRFFRRDLMVRAPDRRSSIVLRGISSGESVRSLAGFVFQRAAFDEANQIDSSAITYLLSRLRSFQCPEVTPQVLMAFSHGDYSNTFMDTLLRPFIKSNDSQRGHGGVGPIDSEKSGQTRWLTFVRGQPIVASSQESLVDILECYSGRKPEQGALIPYTLYYQPEVHPVVKELHPEYESFIKTLQPPLRTRMTGYWG